METVVLNNNGTVVVPNLQTNTVSLTNEAISVVVSNKEAIVVQGNTSSVVPEVLITSSIVSGLLGPPGPQGPAGISEDDVVYTKRIDFISENVLYRGEAVPGTSEATPVWRVRKIELGNDGDVTETWASGSAEFNKQWSLRATYTYT